MGYPSQDFGREVISLRKNIGMLIGLLLLTLALVAGCGNASQTGGSSSSGGAGAAQTASSSAAPMPSGQVKITMLNVGQGDSILVQTAEQTVLIDTSDVDEQEKLASELKKADIKKIDKVILTHPHADHIGGMSLLFQQYSIGEIYDNGVAAKSKAYRNYLKTAQAKGIARHTLKDGDVLDFGGGVSFRVYGPGPQMLADSGDKNYNQNNGSIVGQLVCGNFKMLFTGDAEKEEEQEINGSHGKELKSDVLKSGHHGSRTASSPTFLRNVHPRVCVISCGEPQEKGGSGNTYGHPHQETLKKYNAQKDKVYVTAWNGTITITTDGKTYHVATEHEKGSSNPAEAFDGTAGE